MGQERDDIAMIRALMEDAQDVGMHHGPHFVLWGALAAAALMLTWLAIQLQWEPRGVQVIWVGFLVAGWTGSVVLGRRARHRARRSTLAARVLAGIWVGIAVAATVIALAGLFGDVVRAQAMSGTVAVILGAGYWATGCVTPHPLFRWGAAVWWVSGIAMLVWPGTWTLPWLAVLAVMLEVIPGLRLLAGRPGEVRQGVA